MFKRSWRRALYAALRRALLIVPLFAFVDVAAVGTLAIGEACHSMPELAFRALAGRAIEVALCAFNNVREARPEESMGSLRHRIRLDGMRDDVKFAGHSRLSLKHSLVLLGWTRNRWSSDARRGAVVDLIPDVPDVGILQGFRKSFLILGQIRFSQLQARLDDELI